MESFLDDIGITEEIKKIGIPVDKRGIHLQDGSYTVQYYGKEGEAIYSLSRGILNRKMIDLAEDAGVEFFFEHRIWDISLADATLHIGETERGEWTSLKYDKVFGVDGAFSRIRHCDVTSKYVQLFVRIFKNWLQRIAHPCQS